MGKHGASRARLLKVAGVSMDPAAENTATNAAIPNMPPRKRPMLKTPDALPISVTATELNIAFGAAGIAIETPTPAKTSGAIKFDLALELPAESLRRALRNILSRCELGPATVPWCEHRLLFPPSR